MASDTTNDGQLTKTHRIMLGVLVLFLVDVIWVSSSEATKYLYKNDYYQKPLFTTYVKTSMFSIYLLGLCLWPPWREQCRNPDAFMRLENIDEDAVVDMSTSLSDPQFVPVKRADRSSGTESDDSSVHSVRFNKVAEVRHMSQVDAMDALHARLSFHASQRAGELGWNSEDKLPIGVIARIAFIFCYLWFLANYTFQVSLSDTEPGISTVLSSSSGLFTVILTALFPANSGDRFSLSKLLAVVFGMFGLVLVCYSDIQVEGNVPTGAIFSLISAFFYSAYLVFIRRSVENEDRMDIPLFFGWVGLLVMVTMWPLLFVFHYYDLERFEWPDNHQWLLIVVNGLVGTVLSEVLWLWGCFLSSSLIATMAISLTIPMAMLADVVWKKTHYPAVFYLGIIPCTCAFVIVTLLANYDGWDPAAQLIGKMYSMCRRHRNLRSPEDSEQTEALISVNDGEHEA